MMVAVVQFIKEQKHYIFTLLITLVVVSFGCYVNTIQTTNHSLTVHLQSAENKIQQLMDEKTQLQEQLQSSKSTNQKLLDEKKELQNEIGQNNAELQSAKDNMQRLLEEKGEFERNISQLSAELQSSKDSNQRLLEENQKFQNKTDQCNGKLESVRSENQRLLKDKNEVLKEIIQIRDDREVYSTQLRFIEKWIDCIDKLEEHIHALVHCSESKKRESLHGDSKLCHKIGYDFDESYAGELILNAIDLIMKYKVECRNFLDALLLKKIDKMKNQQAIYDMKKIKDKMEKLTEEVGDVKYQKRKTEKVVPEHQQSKETAVERGSGILSTVWKKFTKWVGGMIAGLFWS